MKRILKIFFLCTALPVCSLSAESLTQYVNPMIGTGGSLSNLFIKYHNLSNIRLLNSYI